MKDIEKDYGKITIGYGTALAKELKIVDYIKCVFRDDRFMHVSKIEDGTYCLAVENLKSSGREPQQTMRLSEESFAGLIATAMLYIQTKGLDVNKMIEEATKDGKKIHYSVSENLENLIPHTKPD
jgi:hypothetical protein